MYCTVSCCTMWLSFATLPVIVWKRSRAASVSFSLSVCLSASLSLFLSLPLSLSFLYLSLQCLHSLSPAQSSVLLSLLCVFFFSTILYLLSRPGMQWPMSSVSLYTVESFCYTCRIGCYFLSWRHKKQTGPIDWSNDVQRYFLFLAKKKQTNKPISNHCRGTSNNRNKVCHQSFFF